MNKSRQVSFTSFLAASLDVEEQLETVIGAHALLEIEDQEELWGHPVYGVSWEGFVIENIISELDRWTPSFFKTAAGAEIDLVLTKGKRQIAVECKASSAPEVGKGFWSALKDLGIKEAWIVAPVKESYPIEKNVFVANLGEFLAKFDRTRQ